MEKKNKLAFVFDMDDTLIEIDHRKEAETLYLELNVIKEHEKMMNFFNFIKMDKNIDVYILTARSTLLTDKIAEYFKIPIENVICRDYCNTINEIKKVVASWELTKEFLEDMVRFKIEILNELSQKYVHITFYEDYALEIKKLNQLNSNIQISLPFHLQHKSQITHSKVGGYTLE